MDEILSRGKPLQRESKKAGYEWKVTDSGKWMAAPTRFYHLSSARAASKLHPYPERLPIGTRDRWWKLWSLHIVVSVVSKVSVVSVVATVWELNSH